ncbi:DinB family protein [Spirosoma arcticum]
MTKSDILVMPGYFDRYINLTEDIELIDALSQAASFDYLLPAKTAEALGDLHYAPGKWTIRDIIQHLIDTERIMAYRALRFARNDQTTLPGFDEELFGQTAHATQRNLAELYQEYALNRQSTIALFRSFDDEMLVRSGICFNQTISALAIGFVLVGHSIHHVNIIRERYLPLLT